MIQAARQDSKGSERSKSNISIGWATWPAGSHPRVQESGDRSRSDVRYGGVPTGSGLKYLKYLGFVFDGKAFFVDDDRRIADRRRSLFGLAARVHQLELEAKITTVATPVPSLPLPLPRSLSCYPLRAADARPHPPLVVE